MTSENQDNPFRATVSGLEKAPSKDVSSETAAYNIITDTLIGVNTRKGDNAFQAKVTFGSVVLFAIIGIVLALLNPSLNLPWFGGALVGSFAGLVLGILASGIILMIYRTMRHLQGSHD